MGKVLDFGRKSVQVVAGVGAVVGSLALAAPAMAIGVADPLVTSTFSGITDDVVATMLAIAPVAITILGVFLAFKFGKKIFNRLSS